MDVIDLIAYANENKPVDFTNAVNDILQQKASDSLDAYKKAIASTMFNSENDSQTDEVDGEDELEFDDEELEQMLDDAEVEEDDDYEEESEESDDEYEQEEDDE